MIKDILKMGGCKTEKEFYKKYPTEQSFLEAFPQARPMMEQYAKGGSADYEPHNAMPSFIYNTTPMMNYGGGMYDYGGGMGTPFDPSIPKVPSYASGGNVSKKTLNDIVKAAKDQMIDPQYIAKELKDIPNAIQTLDDMTASERKTVLSKLARDIKAKMVQQSAQSQMQMQQQVAGQPVADQSVAGNEQTEQMEEAPDVSSEAPMAQYGMSMVNDKLYKFIRGGDIEGYPAAAALPDSDIYRTFPPNMPRLFNDGGLVKFQGVTGSGQFQGMGTSPMALQAMQQANQQAAVSDTVAEMAERSGVYGGTDVGSNPYYTYGVPIAAGTAGALASKYGPKTKEAVIAAAKKAYNLTDEMWKALSLGKKMGYLSRLSLKNPVVGSILAGATAAGLQYFLNDTEVSTGAPSTTPKSLPNGANNESDAELIGGPSISVINPDSIAPDSMFQGMPANVGASPYIFPVDTSGTFKPKQKAFGGVSNQGPMNYGAFPAIMNGGGASPSELKPDNVIDTNNSVFRNYLSDNMQRDRLKKFLENNQDEQMMGMMNPQKKKGGPNLMGSTGIPTYQGTTGSSQFINLGYKGPYDISEDDQTPLFKDAQDPAAAVPSEDYFQESSFDMPGSFRSDALSSKDASFGRTASSPPPPPDYTGLTFDDDITAMPGSFKTDTITRQEAAAGKTPGTSSSNVRYICVDGQPKAVTDGSGYATANEAMMYCQKDDTKKKKGWKSLTGTQKAETVLYGLRGINSAMESRLRRERDEQMDQNIWERQMVSAGSTDKGKYLVNSGDFVPPTMQTPVQFSGYNPNVYAKKGAQVNDEIAYLTDDQIKSIIGMGGQVEFLD